MRDTICNRGKRIHKPVDIDPQPGQNNCGEEMNGHPSTPQSSEERLILLQYDWLRAFLAALSAFQLYPLEHPKAQDTLVTLQQVSESLQAAHDGEISLAHSEQGVLVNHFTIDPQVTAFRRLADELRVRHIHTIIFSQGMDQAEFGRFMTIFAMPPEWIVERGGLGLLLEEAGIRHIRPARLRYAPRTDSPPPSGSLPDHERVLFARMEECLKDEEASGDPETAEDRARQIVSFLENPKTTALYLEQKAFGGSVEPEVVREVIAALEKAGTIVYTRRPDQWSQCKQSIAEALCLLPPILRERVLEIACEETGDSLILEEIVSSLQPQQIATILADYLARPHLEEDSARERAAADTGPAAPVRAPGEGPSEAGRHSETRSESLARLLVRNPDQFQVLRPLLAQELLERGISHQNINDYLVKLRGERAATSGDLPLAPVSSDKALMYTTLKPGAGEKREGIEDLYDTLEAGVKWEALRRIRLELLDREDSPDFYGDVLGPQVVGDIRKVMGDGPPDAAQEALRRLLTHAEEADGAPFPERSSLARELLLGLDSPELARRFLESLESDAASEDVLRQIALARLPAAGQELIRYAFKTPAGPVRDRLLSLIADHLDVLSPRIVGWLVASNDTANASLYLVLEKGLCDGCFPVLRALLVRCTPQTASRVIALLGRLGSEEATQALLAQAKGRGILARMAGREISSLQSPAAVPFLAREIERPFWLGGTPSSRMQALMRLTRILHPSSRRVLVEFLTRPRLAWRTRGCRPMILRAMESVRTWPGAEAHEVLRFLAAHKDPVIARQAVLLRASLGSDGGGEAAS